MRRICCLFFTIFLFGQIIHKNAAELDYDEVLINTKVVEYDDGEDAEQGKPMKKDRIKTIKNFVGTNLFGEIDLQKKCFSTEDVALLAARRDFESLIPKDLPDCLLDDDLTRILMEYFYGAYQVIEKMASGSSKLLAEKVFYDMMGGYLKCYMIPMSRYSFYGGLVKLRTVENVIELYNQCKYALNTNGNGWKSSTADFSDLNNQVEPIRIMVPNEEENISCTQLNLLDEHDGENEGMIVPLPRLNPEEEGVLGNIWLPFKRKQTFSLQSQTSAFILLRYFELTTKCYSFQGIRQDQFNKNFDKWILENLEIHLGDEGLYPGLGGVLRVLKTLRMRNKGTGMIVPKNKRQKTQSFKTLENKIKKLNKSPPDWTADIFDTSKSAETLDNLEQLADQRSKERRMKYIIIAGAVAICCLAIMLVLITYMLYRCRRKTKTGNGKPLPEERPKTGWFCKKSRKEDEEPLLHDKSSFANQRKQSKAARPSKLSAFKTEPKKSSPQETPKCFGTCSKNSSPAVIETSSMDSDSGRDHKRIHKTQYTLQDKSSLPGKSEPLQAKSKTVKTDIVNEKKRFSISRKNKKKEKINPEEEKSSIRVGMLKKET